MAPDYVALNRWLLDRSSISECATVVPLPMTGIEKKLNVQVLNGDRAHRAAENGCFILISLEAA
jgi:hypothetical protein